MLTLKVKSQRMIRTLQTLTGTSNEHFGKIAENVLRRIVTGQGAQSLPDRKGLQQLAEDNAPTPSEIERDIRKLKYALEIDGGGKKLVRMTATKKYDILRERIKRIGHTSRTLILNWAEAFNSRSGKVTGKLSKYHDVTIATQGNICRATFKSKHRGLQKINKDHGIVQKVVSDARKDLMPYAKQVLNAELKGIFK